MNKWWKKFFPDQSAAPAAPADPASPSWLRHVAMVTGILAGFAGYLTVRSTSLSNDAIYQSNRAVFFQAQASDKWAEYQAVSIKARMLDTALDTNIAIDPQTRIRLQQQSKDFRDRQPDLKKGATDLENQREDAMRGGYHRIEEKDQLGYAGLAIQLAIALASVAALTRRRQAFQVSILIGIFGVGITAYAIIFHYIAK